MTTPEPTDIHLDRSRRVLTCTYDDGEVFELDFEYLRTHSPSAEVRGHGFAEPELMTGKGGIDIVRIEPVGSYAVQLVFSDGHDSGLYSWEFLYRLGRDMEANKARYRERLAQAGMDE